MSIDIHAHIIPRDALLKQSLPLPESTSKVSFSDGLWRHEKRVKFMRTAGIEKQVVSVLPASFFYWLDASTAAVASRCQNDAVAMAAKENPELVGCCTVPLQDPEEAVRELERAINDLELSSVEIGTHICGKNLGDQAFWDFYESVEDLNIPIIVHPLDGRNRLGVSALGQYYLANAIGNPVETTIAIATVIFGGVLRKFPRLKFIFLHGGGFAPYQVGRLQRAQLVGKEAWKEDLDELIDKPFMDYFKLLYFDSILLAREPLMYLISLVGPDHVMLGTDYPFLIGDLDPISLINALDIPSEDKRRILWQNASSLFDI